MATLSTAMTLKDDADLELRALATDTIGHVATAVGLPAFERYLQPTTQCALDGVMQLDEPRIRDCTWGFFGSMARLCEVRPQPLAPLFSVWLAGSVRGVPAARHAAADAVGQVREGHGGG